MLEGCVPWPDEVAQQYRQAGVWEGITVAEMVARAARNHPDRTAVIHGDRRTTYRELVHGAQALADGLLGLGLEPLDRAVVQLPNVPEFVTMYLAMNAIGVIPVMALRPHRHAEIRHFVRASGAAAYVIPDVVGSFDYRSMANEMAGEFPSLKHTIVIGKPAPGQVAWTSLFSGREADPVKDRERAQPSPDEVSTMLLSGGTTSLSKLVPRTHNDYVLNARLCARAAGFNSDTVFMAVLPLGHNYNLASPGMLGAFYAGGTLVIATGTDAREVFATVERERVTVIAAAVPLITNWLNSEALREFDCSSLKVVQNGGARLPPELRARVRRELNCVPQEIYGTAEGLINMTRLDDADALLLESSGAPVSDLDEIKVLDSAGAEVPEGETGRIGHERPVHHSRLLQRTARTTPTPFTSDGFYRMGDIVRKRGRYVLHRRPSQRSDQSWWREDQLRRDREPHFRAAPGKSGRLVALPDPVFGEKACACVILHPGTTSRSIVLIGTCEAEDRVLQAARAAGDHGLVPREPGRQDPQA